MNLAARRLNTLSWAAALLFSLYLVLRLFYLINSYSVNLVWWDNYLYYFLLAGHSNYWQRFTVRVGPHRQGASMLLSSILAPLSHWNMRVEAFAIGIILTLAMALCLYMKRRAFGPLTPIDLIILPGIFMTARQYDQWASTVNSAHSALPLLFLMIYCLAWTVGRPRVRNALVLSITFCSTFTGFGFFVGFLTVMSFCIRRNWFALAITVAIYGLFFLGYHFEPAAEHFEYFNSGILDFPYSLALGVANVCGSLHGPLDEIVGYPVLAAMILALAMQLRSFARREIHSTIAVSLISFALFFMLFALEGRISLGASCLVRSRYVTLISTAFVGLYLSIIQLPIVWLRHSCLGIATCLVICGSAPIAGDNMSAMRSLSEAKIRWIQTYLKSGDLDLADSASLIPIYPQPRPSFVQSDINYLRAHHLGFFRNSRPQVNQLPISE